MSKIKKPLIIVVGSNHSGTSLIANLLQLNGAITGICSNQQEKEAGMSYRKFEDSVFKTWCRYNIGFPGALPIGDDKLVSYLNSFNNTVEEMDTTVFMKYPKALWVLKQLHYLDIKREIKIVACMRNPLLQCRSLVEKDRTMNLAGALTAYSATWDVISKINFSLHLVMMDRLDKYEEFAKLLQFCCLKYNDEAKNLTMINKFLRNRTIGEYHLFNIKSEDL